MEESTRRNWSFSKKDFIIGKQTIMMLRLNMTLDE